MSDLTQTFSALSDPTRLALVETLIRRGSLPAGDLVAGTGLSAPAVSRHLKVLRSAGVLEMRSQGTQRIYSARPEALQAIVDWTMDHRAFWSASLDRLDQVLAETPEGDDT